MKTVAMAVIGLFLTATLTACGGGTSEADAEKDARAELKELGFSKKLADCAIAEIKEKAGSLEKYAKLDSSEQQTIASTAGADCVENASDDEIDDVTEGLEDQGLGLSDPELRKSIIGGMTAGGVSEDVANCILDKMIDEDLTVTDVTDATIIGRIAQECQ